MKTASSRKSVSKANKNSKEKNGKPPLNVEEPFKYVLPEKIIEKHYAKEIKGIHPVARIFPLATEEEHKELCQSIKQYGLNNPLIRDKKTKILLDGRSRLMACFAVNKKLKFEDVSIEDLDSPNEYIYQLNTTRKHWSKQQLAAIAVDLAKIYEIEAKKKIGGDKKSLPKKLGNGKKTKENESAVKAGNMLKVNSDYVQKAKTISEYSPELFEQVKTDKIGIVDAYTQVKAIKREQKKEQAIPVTEKKVPLIDVKGKTVAMVNEPQKHQFNSTNDSVDWAKWTWNPVTGCNHGCNFCYAREIAHTKINLFPAAFEPVFMEHRLVAPVNTKVPSTDDPTEKRVFVCSMADLFGKWVPDEWIKKVFDACMTNPDWEYLFLTKWPNRYKMLEALPKAWFGASVIKQGDVKRIESQMQLFKTNGIKWISLEPMLEPITFKDISWCNLMVIGSQTATNQPEGHVPAKAINFEWIYDVVTQCKEQGVPYYLKANCDNTIWTKNEPSVKLNT